MRHLYTSFHVTDDDGISIQDLRKDTDPHRVCVRIENLSIHGDIHVIKQLLLGIVESLILMEAITPTEENQ